jgi:hypothetical protein
MKRMQTQEQNPGNRRHGVPSLTRRLSLRVRYARPEQRSGQGPEKQSKDFQFWSELMSWQTAARFWRTLVVVKRPRPSSLERGSAATRTVVRSISWIARSNELTHLSRINRR